MNQNGTRKGTREKKPSRFHYYEETDVNAFPGQKNSDQKLAAPAPKDKLTSAQEINQIAKLFCKFVLASNSRYLDFNESQQEGLVIDQPDLSKEIDSRGLPQNKRNESRPVRNTANDPKNLRSREVGQVANKEPKVSNKEVKSRAGRNGKNSSTLASSLDTDLNYHNALNEHLKNSYPNIKSLSPDMLRELAIPTEIMNKNPILKPKPKDEKKVIKVNKDENKPFKRQSYHIAIAYHIHLKQIKASKPPEYVDPTYASRKLRQQAQKQGQ